MAFTPSVHNSDKSDFSVCDSEGLILEVFATRANADAYVAEWVAAPPTTYGDRLDLAARHSALYRTL
jgi:hypothetical protein